MSWPPSSRFFPTAEDVVSDEEFFGPPDDVVGD